MSRNIVDLTLSSDSDEEPAKKRRRCQSTGGWGASAGNQANDNDVIVVDPVRPRPRPSVGSTDLGDEDLVITGAVGTVATRDLPHPRPDCAEHRFTAATSTSNANSCPQCYCYVCDVKASECRFWGTGARERDHANARPLGYWRRLREAARGGNTNWVHTEYHSSGPLGNGIPPKPSMQQTRLPFPLAGRQSSGSALAAGGAPGGQQGLAALSEPAAPGGVQVGVRSALGDSTVGGMTPSARRHVHSAAAASAAPEQANQPAHADAAAVIPPRSAGSGAPAPSSSGVCKLRPLPDPSCDRQAFELGVLRFGVKAVRGTTIADLAARLQRFGFYYSIGTKQDDYGSRLALDSLLDSRFGFHGGKYKSKAVHLKMLPLPPPPEEAVPVPMERVRKVLVVDCLGRARATMMGVRVHAKAKRADLLEALAPKLRPLFSASSELLHLVHFNSFESNSIKVVEADATLDDSFFSNICTSEDGAQLVVYRTAHHPAPTWPVASNGSADLRAPSDGASNGGGPAWTEIPVYAHSSSAAAPSSSGSTPAWVVAQIRQFERSPDPSTPSDRYTNLTTRLAASLLVPLRKEHAKGGRDAERDFNAMLLRGLQGYRTPSPLSAAHAAPAVVLRGNRSYLADRPAQTNSARWGNAGESIGSWMPGSSLVQLTAVMADDLPATCYRLTEMRTPLVDPSASPEALRESETNIAESKRRGESYKRRKELLTSCISELVVASRRPHLEDKAAMAYLANNGSCKCATDVTLCPSRQPGADPRKGDLVVKVYAWSSGGLGRSSLFLPWDEWPSIGKRDDVRFPLPRTMELLATGVADPSEQALMAAEATAAADGSGPGTSRGLGPTASGTVGLAPELQIRVQAERRRARSMVASAKELCSTQMADRHRSINLLLEFMQSGERSAVQQPPGLTVTMRPYQLQSLAFMLELERLVDTPSAVGHDGGAGPSTSAGLAPAVVESDPADAPDGGCPGGYRRLFWLPITNTKGQRYWYSPVYERLTMAVPAQPIGGFLAEEMGLGKTVVSVGLTLANPAPPSVVPGATLPCGRLASRATLVVCAVSLVGQWQAEAQSKTGGSCRIHPYHGQSRIRDPKRLATEFDIVVTTYQTLQSDHAAGAKDPCQQIKWHRVIFDEGHTLRNASAKLYKTAVELAADRKWLCTGTPINNAVEDLLGQFGAIHLMPMGKKTYFDSYIKYPFLVGAFRNGLTSTPLLYVLRHTMVRHTKAQNLAGEGVLQLPEKTETDVPVYLSAKEQELYRKVHKEAQRGWQKLKAAGVAYVNSHLFTATSMLMPLRRICSGGLLRSVDLAVPDPERLSAVAGANSTAGGTSTSVDKAEVPVPADISECPICVDTLEQPVVTPCNHWFCRECLTGWLNSSPHHNCPACRQSVTVATLRRGVLGGAAEPTDATMDEDVDGEPSDGIPCESKLQRLLVELRAMRSEDPKAKALVFTQFSQTLDWLKPRLLAEGFGHRTITGDMTQKKRTEAIDSFQRDPNTCVFLLSVRSGAVGINLTAANYVFLLEPCMNPAMEEQAIGRSWRMGQQRPVVVKRFFVKGSVEERIMEVVKMRRSAGGGSEGNAASSTVPLSGRANGRNAGAVTAGSLRQDKTDLRINELELMFRNPDFPQPHAAEPS